MDVTLRLPGICQENGKPLVEPVVPMAAIDAIVRTSFAAEPNSGPAAARARLLHHYEELRELALAGVAAGHNRVQDAVRLALDTAAAGSDAGSAGDVVEVVSRTRLHRVCLQPDRTPASAAGHVSPAPNGVTGMWEPEVDFSVSLRSLHTTSLVQLFLESQPHWF